MSEASDLMKETEMEGFVLVQMGGFQKMLNVYCTVRKFHEGASFVHFHR
jgi:hypothetical protein